MREKKKFLLEPSPMPPKQYYYYSMNTTTSQAATDDHNGVDLVSFLIMFAAEDFETGCTTIAITARVLFCLEVGFIALWYTEMNGAIPVAVTRSWATLPIGVSRLESSVHSSLGVVSWGGKGDGASGKDSSDGNEELHSITKHKK